MQPTPTSVDDPAEVSRVLAQGYGLLRFPGSLEDEFRGAHAIASRRWVRMGLYVATAVSLIAAAVDPWVMTSEAAAPALVRLFIQAPTLLLLLLAAADRFYARWWTLAIQIGAPMFALGTLIVTSYAEPQYSPLIGARLLLVCFYVYFLAGLRAEPALRTNAMILALLVVIGAAGLLSQELTIFLTISLLSACVIGGAGAYALEHAQRTAFLERKLLVQVAELDGLTRLTNRHTFDSHARAAWARASAAGHSATVLMIDVDHFKLYNDHYGHPAGDECLRLVAGTLRSALNCRPGELIARYGGEEIVVLLFDRELREAQDLALRVVASVRALNLAHVAAAAGQITVSVGAATQPSPLHRSYDDLLREADRALYAAKHQGRNRAVVVEVRAAAAA